VISARASVVREPSVARVVLLLALLGGIVTMHAVAVTPGHQAHRDTVAMAATGEHHGMSGHHQSTDTSCGDDGCGSGHTGMHGCVFVMTAVSVIAGLALLCWIGVGCMTAWAAQPFHQRRRRQRAPPWTVLSLFELSILRV
jgi:uncharacterized low-complexity protein